MQVEARCHDCIPYIFSRLFADLFGDLCAEPGLTQRRRVSQFDQANLTMKKLKNEKELIKKAIAEGVKYGEERGVVEFEPTDSATEKIEYIYRLLVHDKVIQPLPQDQVSQLTMRHRLAIWASKLK